MSEENNYLPHISVLKDECLTYLTEPWLGKKALFADLTFGAGGHSLALLQTDPLFKVMATDQDREAIEHGQKFLADHQMESRCQLLHTNFKDFPHYMKENLPTTNFQGILIDLGVSSHHLDSAERGLSFRKKGPLDMRMDLTNDDIPTAADLLNQLSQRELQTILQDYGEDPLAGKIAAKIVDYRDQQSFETTDQLEELVFYTYPPKWRHGRTHPATRTFQALRIAVNDELSVLKNVLPDLLDLLSPQGVLAIITFHSLEDRIVKVQFKEWAQQRLINLLTKKPLTPSSAELENNFRSRSAKLRVIAKKEF